MHRKREMVLAVREGRDVIPEAMDELHARRVAEAAQVRHRSNEVGQAQISCFTILFTTQTIVLYHDMHVMTLPFCVGVIGTHLWQLRKLAAGARAVSDMALHATHTTAIQVPAFIP